MSLVFDPSSTWYAESNLPSWLYVASFQSGPFGLPSLESMWRRSPTWYSSLQFSCPLLSLFLVLLAPPIPFLQPIHARLACLCIPHEESVQLVRSHNGRQGDLVDIGPVSSGSFVRLVVARPNKYRQGGFWMGVPERIVGDLVG